MSDATWARTPNETATQHQLRVLVRKEVASAGLSQSELSQRLGCSTKHMSQLMTGKSPLTLNWVEAILRQIGKHLELDVADDPTVEDSDA